MVSVSVRPPSSLSREGRRKSCARRSSKIWRKQWRRRPAARLVFFYRRPKKKRRGAVGAGGFPHRPGKANAPRIWLKSKNILWRARSKGKIFLGRVAEIRNVWQKRASARPPLSFVLMRGEEPTERAGVGFGGQLGTAGIRRTREGGREKCFPRGETGRNPVQKGGSEWEGGRGQ